MSASTLQETTTVHPTGTGHWVHRWAIADPDAPLIITEDAEFTWGEFDARVTGLAGSLAEAGVGAGDRVACLMENRVEFLELFWATARIGAIFVPLNNRLTVTELEHVLGAVDAKVLGTEPYYDEQVSALRAAGASPATVWMPDPSPLATASFGDLYVTRRIATEHVADPSTVAAILFTSGTTGRPKGAMITHGNIAAQATNWNTSFGCTRRDRQIVFLPLCFTGGLISACMSTFLGGGSMVLVRKFDPATVLALVEQHRPTYFTAVPLMVQRMFDHPDAASTDLTSLRLVESGGAPVPVPLIEQVRRLGLELIQGYGLTEATGGVNLHLQEKDNFRKAGSCGMPGLFNSARVVDATGRPCAPGEPGELLLSGPMVFAGYWQNPEATAETLVDGWLHTGDLAIEDEEGFFFLVGRTKELIVTGGLNVYPNEVEEVLRTHPAVADVAVVGTPDDTWGESTTAFVITRGKDLNAADLLDHCRVSLADYKVPKRVHFLDDFPRTTSGKVVKSRLVSPKEQQ